MLTPGATTSARRALNANGAIVMHPDFPQPTGSTMPTSRCSRRLSAAYARRAA